MARPRTPDGRRVPVSFKLTEAEAALVDSLCGETGRSVWLRERAMSGLAVPESIARQQHTEFLPDGTPASEQVRPPDPNPPRYGNPR